MEVKLPSLSELSLLDKADSPQQQKSEKSPATVAKAPPQNVPESLRGRFSAEELEQLENKQKSEPVTPVDLDEYDDESEPLGPATEIPLPETQNGSLEEVKQICKKEVPAKGNLVLVRKNVNIGSSKEDEDPEDAYEALLAAQEHQNAVKKSYELETIELEPTEMPESKEVQNETQNQSENEVKDEQNEEEMLFRKPKQMSNNFFSFD